MKRSGEELASSALKLARSSSPGQPFSSSRHSRHQHQQQHQHQHLHSHHGEAEGGKQEESHEADGDEDDDDEEEEDDDDGSGVCRSFPVDLPRLVLLLQREKGSPARLWVLSSLHALLEDEEENDFLLLAEESRALVMETLPPLLLCNLWNEKDPQMTQRVVRILATMAVLSFSKGYGFVFHPKKQRLELNTPLYEDYPAPQRYGKSEINLNQSPDEEQNLSSEPSVADCNNSLYEKACVADQTQIAAKEDSGLDCSSWAEEFHQQVLHNFLLYLQGDCLDSISLKLQILRSLHLIAERGIIPMDALAKLPKILGSFDPFIRAQTLQLISMVLFMGSGGKSFPGKESFMGLFREYTSDPSVVVRKSALKSQILLHSNGYPLTKESYTLASSFLEDLDEEIRSVSLHMIKHWVEQNPEDNSNDAFIRVCKLMIDMDLSVRIEACKVLAVMKNVKEDLLLQALSKKPLGITSSDKESISSSVITIPETDIDVSKYEQGLGILDKVNMGAFVHGIEDEFYEVRALTVKALEAMYGCSTKARNLILEVMMNMICDDSKHVRLHALQALIHASDRYGLSIKDNDLHTLHATLGDIDEDVRILGLKLLGKVQLSSKDAFRLTVETLMNHIQKSQWEQDLIDALYSLGRGHNKYLLLITKDLLKELKVNLCSDVGLDAPICRCILTLFCAVSEDANFIPGQILSLVQLFKQIAAQGHPRDTISQDGDTFGWTKSISLEPKSLVHAADSSEVKKGLGSLLEGTIRSVWNIKAMLGHGKVSSMKQMLSGSRRDLKCLLASISAEEQAASTSLTLRYVDFISLLLEGWVHFHKRTPTAATVSLHQLACRLDFIVTYMLHAFLGHTPEQKFSLLEMSILPMLWRMTEKVDEKDCKSVATILMTIKTTGLPFTEFMVEVQENIVKAWTRMEALNIIKTARRLACSFWPTLLSISNSLRELKADLSIVSSDPLPFQLGLPLGMPVKVHFWNLKRSDRIWVHVRMTSLWSRYIFLNTESLGSVGEMATTLHVPGSVLFSSGSTLEASVILECPPAMQQNDGPGPKGYVLPLTRGREIQLVDITSSMHAAA